MTVAQRIKKHISINQTTGCWEWIGAMYKSTGYGKINVGVRRSGIQKMTGAHRAAYNEFCGSIPSGMFVCHSCDNRRCVNPKHLFLGTHRDNMDDMVAKGKKRGSSNPSARLDEKSVMKIRNLFRCGASCREIAKMYCVNRGTIYDVVTSRSWKHVAQGDAG
jgi:hypothetical protein